MGKLTFEKPNPGTFRALSLAYEVARTGGTAAVVFNAANEAAVEEFLAGRIRFVNIVELIERCLDKHEARPAASPPSLPETIGTPMRSAHTLSCPMRIPGPEARSPK